jgi:hypothetical protein
MNILNISIFNHLIYPIYNFIILYIYIWHIYDIYPAYIHEISTGLHGAPDNSRIPRRISGDRHIVPGHPRPTPPNQREPTVEPTGTNGNQLCWPGTNWSNWNQLDKWDSMRFWSQDHNIIDLWSICFCDLWVFVVHIDVHGYISQCL